MKPSKRVFIARKCCNFLEIYSWDSESSNNIRISNETTPRIFVTSAFYLNAVQDFRIAKRLGIKVWKLLKNMLVLEDRFGRAREAIIIVFLKKVTTCNPPEIPILAQVPCSFYPYSSAVHPVTLLQTQGRRW